jgi:uncharacterized membrane protein
MTDTAATPQRRWDWLKIALVASLALNLLIGAAVATRFIRGQSAERFPLANQIQLIPRKFLGELPKERRREITQVLNRYRKDVRANRDVARAASLKLADALSAEPYSAEQAKAAIANFATQGSTLVSRGGDVALEVLQMLTPEERKQLADAMRERAAR